MTIGETQTERYSFSGHETFPFRYSWLPKGMRHLRENPELFSDDEAIVTLGLGKNMVKSTRFWLEALELAERIHRERRLSYEATELGDSLLGEGGWDPFLEDPGTLWLLHWHLVETHAPASTWHLAFTRWNETNFTRERLVSWLREHAETAGLQATESSIKRDVEVFVRTYVPAQVRRTAALEDAFDCPLVELGLIEEEGGAYRFVRGPKPTLPDLIFVYALLRFWNRNYRDQSTLSFEKVIYGQGSPGAAFKLSESDLAERLEGLPTWSGLSYDDTAGMRTLLRHTAEAEVEPLTVLETYYSLSFGGSRIAEVLDG